MSKPNSGYIDPDLVIGIFRFSDFLFPVRQRLWVSFGVATLPHLPVMNLWKKLMDIQKPLAGVTRCASWQEGRWGEHYKKTTPPPILHMKRSDILPGEIGSLGVRFSTKSIEPQNHRPHFPECFHRPNGNDVICLSPTLQQKTTCSIASSFTILFQ